MTDHHLSLNQPYQQGDPLDMDDAREASRRIARLRRDAEAEFRGAVDDVAAKEAAYREALSKAIVRLKTEDGTSSTEATERARGESSVKQKLIDFRVAEGMLKAYAQRLTGLEGERSQLKSLIDYSARVGAALRDQEDQPGTVTHGSGRPRAVA